MAGRGPTTRRRAACCGAGSEEITQVDIRGDGMTVGIVGLKELFEQLYAEGLSPEEAVGDRILAAIKAHNYVSRSAEETYRAALLREYAAFRAQKRRENRVVGRDP